MSNPLLKSSSGHAKEAIHAFELIQKIMGDKKSKKTITENVFELLSMGVNVPELRDEIYCQVIKQLTNNPAMDSVLQRNVSIFRGWSVFAVITRTFLPYETLQPYVLDLVRSQRGLHGTDIDKIIDYSLRKLNLPRGSPHFIPLEDIEAAMEEPFYHHVFGVSLTELMERQKDTEPHLFAPKVLVFLTQSIILLGGHQTEGIFRISGSPDEIYRKHWLNIDHLGFKQRLNKGIYNLTGITSPHVPANMLKIWLRELKSPLIPKELAAECLISTMIDSVDSLARVQSIINRLEGIFQVLIS